MPKNQGSLIRCQRAVGKRRDCPELYVGEFRDSLRLVALISPAEAEAWAARRAAALADYLIRHEGETMINAAIVAKRAEQRAARRAGAGELRVEAA